jgi:hypothetical protein
MDIARDGSTRAAETKPVDALPVYQWLGITTPRSEGSPETEAEDDGSSGR